MKTEKHTSYYKLLEALTNHQGCALCFLEENAVRSYFTSVLHENVNDPGTRSSLWQSKVYCRIHAQMLASMGDGLGVAILYEDLFAGLISDLETMKASGTTSWKRPFRAWLVHTDCPACQKARDATERYGSLLFAAVEDAELRETLEKSAGLCLPHLAALLTRPAEDEYGNIFCNSTLASTACFLQNYENFVENTTTVFDRRVSAQSAMHGCVSFAQ